MTVSPVVVGVPRVTVAAQLASAFATWFAGQAILTGDPDCVTVTMKLQVPPPVEDVAVTVVVPTGKNEPDGGEAVTLPQSPAVVSEPKVTKAPDSPP